MPYSLSHVVDQHAEETAILWSRRVRLATEPHVSREALARLDGQIVAHLEGLVLAEDEGRLAAGREFDNWPHPGAAFTVAALALQSARENDWRRACDAAVLLPGLTRALASALAWQPRDAVRGQIDALLADSRPAAREIGLRAAGLHRYDAGEPLWRLMEQTDVGPAQARVCRCVVELGRADLAPRLARLAEIDSPTKFAAAWSLAWFGAEADLQRLRELASQGHERAEAATVILAARLPGDQAADWLRDLFATGAPLARRAAVAGIGWQGDPALVPWLLELMQSPPLARLAGESLATICGIHLAVEQIEGPWPAGFAAGPSEDPADDNVDLDIDENRPWPDPDRAAAWWQRHGGRFVAGVRHLAGKPIDNAWLGTVLRHGLQRQRAAAARELAWRHPGQPLYDIRAPGWRQG